MGHQLQPKNTTREDFEGTGLSVVGCEHACGVWGGDWDEDEVAGFRDNRYWGESIHIWNWPTRRWRRVWAEPPWWSAPFLIQLL